MNKVIKFKEENFKVSITLEDENGNQLRFHNIENHAITGLEIYDFLDFHKGDVYSCDKELDTDSQQMKELKKMFVNIKEKINSLSNSNQQDENNDKLLKEPVESK